MSVLKRIRAINNQEREILPDFYSKELRGLVDFLMIVDQQKRPTI